jgi:hypothetical protein
MTWMARGLWLHINGARNGQWQPPCHFWVCYLQKFRYHRMQDIPHVTVCTFFIGTTYKSTLTAFSVQHPCLRKIQIMSVWNISVKCWKRIIDHISTSNYNMTPRFGNAVIIVPLTNGSSSYTDKSDFWTSRRSRSFCHVGRTVFKNDLTSDL